MASPSLYCTICESNVPFANSESLQCHLGRMHLKCLPYHCTLCSERYPTEASTGRHMESDHSTRPGEYEASPSVFPFQPHTAN